MLPRAVSNEQRHCCDVFWGLVDTSNRKQVSALGSLSNSHDWPKGAKCCVPTDANSCHKHPEVKELEVPKTCFGYPDINFLFGHHPIPIWERIPWPVSSSVPRPMMKPIIARRPFQVSAKDEKPNLLSIASLKNVTILQVLLGCCPKWINRIHIPCLCAVPGFDSTREPPGWKRSFASSHPVASYGFGIWVGLGASALIADPCVSEAKDFGRTLRYQAATIEATWSALGCRCQALASTHTAVMHQKLYALRRFHFWSMPEHAKAPTLSGLLLTLDGPLLIERTIASLCVLVQNIRFDVAQGAISPLASPAREKSALARRSRPRTTKQAWPRAFILTVTNIFNWCGMQHKWLLLVSLLWWLDWTFRNLIYTASDSHGSYFTRPSQLPCIL